MIQHASQSPTTDDNPGEPRWKIDYQLSDDLHASAVRRYWLRTHGLRMIVVNAILVGYIAALWAFDRIAEYRMPLSIGVACVVLFSILTHARFFIRCRNELRSLPHRGVTLRLTDRTLYVERGGTPMPLPWQSILRIIKGDRFWLLKYGIDQFVILPRDKVPNDALDFAENQILAAGAGEDIGCAPCQTRSNP